MDLSVIQNGRDTLFVRTWTSIDECGNTTILRQNVYKLGSTIPQSNGSIVDDIVKQLSENQADTICFKNTHLDSTYTVTNICPDSTTSTAVFTLIRGGSCVVVNAVKSGVSTACFQVCDNRGHCDTTYIRVVILARLAQQPRLKEDYAITRRNKGIEIPVFQNDSVLGIVKSFDIKLDPKKGTATTRQIGNEYYIIYIPKDDNCSTTAIDEVAYEICNQIGCDQAMVHITTLCDGLVVRNGFSPNDDGVNDKFVIENLVDFPNTQVAVYNRWGTRVYLSKDYKNDWKGDFNGVTLPDGTYFYQVLLENGENFTGYLQISR
jgi:gliding motility-associated-like protein